jgi:hypothetical protein
MTTKVSFMTRVDKNVRKLAREKARQQNRALNNYVESLVLKDLGLELPIAETEETNEYGLDFS